MKRKQDIIDEEPRFYSRAQLHYAGITGIKHDLVPSVTTILQAKAKGIGFNLWLGNSKSYRMAARHRDRRAEVGLSVHKKIAKFFDTGKLRVSRKSKSRETMLLRNFLTFVQGSGINPKKSLTLPEQIVYDPKLGYAGTLDLLTTVGGKTIVVDWKTTTGKHPKEHIPQVAAYAHAIEHQLTGNVDECWIVYLQPRRKFTDSQVVRVDRNLMMRGKVAFWSIFNVWKWDNDKYVQWRASKRTGFVPVASIIKKRKEKA